VEATKSGFTLISGSLGSPEGAEAKTGKVVRLLPDFPVRPSLAIDLLQTEILPVDG